MKIVIIYHFPCQDGFASRIIADHFLKPISSQLFHIPGQHNNTPNLEYIVNSHVYFLDFAYSRDVMESICKLAKSVTILDHHVSSKKSLEGLNKKFDNVAVYYDEANRNDYSGVGITWEYFNRLYNNKSGVPLPKLAKHIQDRDLWKFELPNTREICTALDSYDWHYTKWYDAMFNNTDNYSSMVAIGETLLAYQDTIVNHFLETIIFEDLFGFENVPVVTNCPKMLISTVLEKLYNKYPPISVGRSWSNDEKMWTWSIRTNKTAPIADKIAVAFGGGGHVHASGFKSKTLDIEPIEGMFIHEWPEVKNGIFT